MASLGAHAPARLGRYELLARLATGGMGEIFLARLEGAAGFEKLVVVKRILPHLADDARFRAMLIAEARITSKISHANICQVHELGETEGQLYIVMEYLEGVTLLPLLRRYSKQETPLDLGFIAGVIQQTADALHYAHELRDRNGEAIGLVHRDVTPSNIFLTESGMAKVLDFGIAKVKDTSVNTQTGTVKGKYAYMSPEQLRGTAIDRRADVFALGIVVYELLALRRLFQRATDYLTFRAVMEQPIPDVRRYRPDLPDALVAAMLRALERDPANRFATARQLGTAMLDAIAPVCRPWSHGEIGDFVRATFADELAKRSAQVALVARSGEPTQVGVEPSSGHDDDDEFPSVDSAVMHTAPEPHLRAHPAAAPTEFAGHTPPPFAGETHASGPSLQPLGPQPPAAAKRGLFWPVIAVALVAITGGALALVWKQMENQRAEPPPFSGQIVAGPGGIEMPTAADADVVEDAAPASTAPPDEPPPKTPGSTKRPPAPPRDPYKAEIQRFQPQIYQCANQHAFKGEATGTIRIGADGRAKAISFAPVSIDGSPLGTCVRNVLSGLRFPKATVEKEISFKIRAS